MGDGPRLPPLGSWPRIQQELEASGELDRDTATIAQRFGLGLSPRDEGEKETFAFLYPAEILAKRMLEAGHIGFLCHLVAEPERCLYEAVRIRNPVLVKYYVERRAPISRRTWREALMWGSRSIYEYILRHSPVDYITDCDGITPDLEFVDHLIELYQLSSRVQQLNWLLRLAGGALTLDQIDSLQLPPIQRKECLKGMAPDLMRTAMERWKIPLDPYLAGLTGDPKNYYQFLATELWHVPMISVEPEKVDVTEGIFYRTEMVRGKPVRMPIQKGSDPKVEERRRLYDGNSVKVLIGLCDRLQQVPKEAAGMIASQAQHFPHHTDPEPGFRPISWYRSTIEQGKQNEQKSPRYRKPDDFNYDFAREVVFSTALKESCIEALQELHRDGPVDYAQILARARTSQIVEWCFGLITAEGRPITLIGIELDVHDPYYSEVVAAHRKWYPGAPYLPPVGK